MRNTSGAAYAASKYIEIPVREECTLMDFLLKQMGITRNRAKDLLSGRAVTIDRKLTTRHDTPLHVGEVVRVSLHRQNTMLLNKYVKIVYEDKDIVVIEKNVGILSMASTPKQYCIKNVLDAYFEKRHFKCTAHVVHRLDRETSGLMIYAKNIEVLKAKHAENKWSVPKNNLDEYLKKVKQLQQEGLSADEITEELKTLTKYPRFADFVNYWYFDNRGLFAKFDLGGVPNGNKNLILNPLTNTLDPIPPGGFRFSTAKMQEW